MLEQILFDLNQRIATLEERLGELGYSQQRLVETSVKRTFKLSAQVQTLYAPIVGYCVSTIDPLGLNRVRVYHPLLCEPDAKISSMPLARNCTNTGGIDDCGGNWVPPAGSSVVILCENGDRHVPIVIGTVWQKDRGPNGSKFPCAIDEFYRLWRSESYRGEGYLFGKTDGSQVYPPWSSESKNGNDFDNEKDIDKDPDAQNKITFPNIYGWKTPGKHMIKMVDGDYRCNNRWSRFELMSKTGIWFMMKDDFFHPAGEWANPKGCGSSGAIDNSECDTVSALTSLDIFGIEDANGDFAGAPGIGTIGGTAGGCKSVPKEPQCSNPYFKRSEECRPYKGANTPQNNKISLPQSGAQIQSLSGHQIVLDDSVNLPKEEKISWKRDFNFGCDNIFKGKMFLKSATGHQMGMSDSETVPEVRDKENGIKFNTACGHFFKMIDDTTVGCKAGDSRALSFGSTSGHVFEMVDKGNEQCSPTRKEGGVPKKKANQAFVQLRTGYGLIMRFDDSTSQEDTKQQYIMLAAIPKNESNSCKNQPHTLLMQLSDSGGGFVELSSGGKFVLTTRDDYLESVGTEECPSDKLVDVFGNYLLEAKEFMFTKSKTHLDVADKYIILAAGQDCNIDKDNAVQTAEDSVKSTGDAVDSAIEGENAQQTQGPCIFPLIIAKDPQICPLTGFTHWTTYSNRVFGSSS